MDRTSLWNRASAPWAWALPWALAAACAVPWLLPEDWGGSLPRWVPWVGWGLVLLSAPLVRWRRWAPLPLALLLAWVTLGALRHRALADRALPTGWAELEGRISEPWSRQGERLKGRLQWGATEVILSLPGDVSAPPPPGTPVRVRAELMAVDPAPAFLAERPRWRALDDGSPRRAFIPSGLVFEILGPPAPSPALRLRTWARQRFEALPLEPLGRDLWGALALGIPPVQDEVFAPFAESGTLHVLVVSGLQVSLMMLLAGWLARPFGRWGLTVAALGAGLAFASVVGFSAPVWRGLLMGAAWALGRASGWRLAPVLGLHGALLAWLLAHPGAGCDPGFLLAWWALLALLWGTEPMADLLQPLAGPLARPLATLVAPWAATLPLLAIFHGGAPVWAVLANAFILPAVLVLTPVCLALTLLPWTAAVAAVGALLAWIGGTLLPRFAALRPLGTDPLWPWLLLILGWLVLAQARARFRRTRAITLGLTLATVGLLSTRGTGRAPTTLTLEAMDIGQGDALLIRQPGGDATLIDTGPGPWAARRIARTLSRRGVREPVHLVLTHPHGDHAGGYATLGRLWPLASLARPALHGAEDPWLPFGAMPITLDATRGARWNRGESTFSVRWPAKAFDLPDANMVSLVLRVDWRDRQLWLMGDALGIQERDLLDLGDPGPGTHRILKAGHHGSRSSSDPDWVHALAPEQVLLTAGRRNRFGHPHAETLATLQGLPTHHVGEARGILLQATPTGWRVTPGLPPSAD
ncbi:MAG TPA: ComEC/Rec2 family competence protein [Holophagaceae bacterium]|nr:ComEC/Rec2 family competence protein [Holophagaceae bacterium]